jgi:UDP-N-acetylmuramoylalanine--D-glutamate ligase
MKRIVILGAGESGAGAAVLAKKEGFDVFVSDTSMIKDRYKQLLDQHHIAWEEGRHTEELILNADEVIKSPGIPKEAPMVQKLLAQGTRIVSEIEFAGRYTHSKMVCITGSNGKTTTTSLIYHIFKAAGYDAGLAGNIGKSLALQVAEEPHEYYIIELSSFQLDDMYDFRANIAILLNITPDHLDRYNFEFQKYVDAKMRIIRNQTPEDSFIYWNDDPVIKRQLDKYDIKAVQCPFSELKEKGSIGYIEEGQYKLEYPTPFNMEQEELSLTGKHNIYNSLAAGLASNISGIKKETIRRSLSDFPGVEHRLEKVCKVAGVQYINDSKATNVDACWYALESMRTPTVLILGGKDKGNDYSVLVPLVKEKVKAIVCLGIDNHKIREAFEGIVGSDKMVETRSAEDAVKEATKFASPGDVVLLSPCCASFDLFHNMEERGNKFKEAVRRL